ncbi:hypothetical protein AWZ03_003740 [Drosophila navojoa]|uniref:Uncharacterized protein n=1 Tax=Drosophila navojoa TaxID=7232 RepID=A0A484BNH7_DRONA|nr:hypothetical protein AWZ03_003740 [Drosophila navojoa]
MDMDKDMDADANANADANADVSMNADMAMGRRCHRCHQLRGFEAASASSLPTTLTQGIAAPAAASAPAPAPAAAAVALRLGPKCPRRISAHASTPLQSRLAFGINGAGVQQAIDQKATALGSEEMRQSNNRSSIALHIYGVL